MSMGVNPRGGASELRDRFPADLHPRLVIFSSTLMFGVRCWMFDVRIYSVCIEQRRCVSHASDFIRRCTQSLRCRIRTRRSDITRGDESVPCVWETGVGAPNTM